MDPSSITDAPAQAAAKPSTAPPAPASEPAPAPATAVHGVTTSPEPSSAQSLSSFSVDLSIDTNNDDVNSDISDMSTIRSSVSATSSVFEFVEEFGRTYHKYKEGKYLLPNDEQEQNRLDLQHHLATRLLEGKLHLAPIGSDVHRVLDIGTGTGIWAVEFAEQHPEADVLGTDLSPIQPEYVPPNLRFEVDDIEDEWVYTKPFDFIHGRYILPSLKQPRATLQRIFEHLRPGGWVEIMETLMVIEAIDDSLSKSVLPRWHNLIMDGVLKMGRGNPMVPLNTRQWLTEIGFVNVTEKKFAVPCNGWARGDEQKIRGHLMMTNLLEVAQGITMSICTKVWGWTKEEVEVFLVDVRAALRDRANHGFVPILCVYAQKPDVAA